MSAKDFDEDMTWEAYEAHTGCCFVCKGTTIHGDSTCKMCWGTGEAYRKGPNVCRKSICDDGCSWPNCMGEATDIVNI